MKQKVIFLSITALFILLSFFLLYKQFLKSKFLINGCPVSKNQPWVRGRAIECTTSPNSQFIAKIIYNGYQFPQKYFELFIINTGKNKEWKIFEGDDHTMSLDWTPANQIEIKWDCGSGCLSSKVIGLNENISLTDYEDGKMNEQNGWYLQFSPSFPEVKGGGKL